MCGIYGEVVKKSINNNFFVKAREDCGYRGLDENRQYESFNDEVKVCFGHARLTITGDLNSGQQPVINENMVMAYNGEIFSFDDTHVNGISDTELLAKSLNDGISDDLLNTLNGFFAIALYYHKSNTLYLIRDRFGEKPLYYRIVEDSIFFSSVAKSFNTLGVGEVSSIREAPGGGILFNEDQPTQYIKQVPPGHVLIFRNGNHEIRKWYKPQINRNLTSKKYTQVVDEFERLLFDAVKIRIRDQDNVAVSLSGGLDSTLILDMVKQIGGVNIEAFTLSTSDPQFNELDIVNHHADKIGVKLNVINEPYHDLKQFYRCFDVLEFPSFNYSFVGYDSYYKAIKDKGLRVIIEGHGPDEYLGGYPPMLLAYIAGRLMKGNLKDALLGITNFEKTYNKSRLQTVLGIFRQTLNALIEGKIPSGQRINYEFFDKLSTPITLRTFDRISMLNQLETRSPFMDYRLVEFSKSLPDSLLFFQGRSKSIIRTILEARGFKESDFGPKVGFTGTYNNILRDLSILHGFSDLKDSNVRTQQHKNSFLIANALSQNLFSNNT
jgi:asparagine synthase (glutamine-hydrolysing)